MAEEALMAQIGAERRANRLDRILESHGSRELEFAIAVVNYIKGTFFPRYTHQLTSPDRDSEQLTTPIRMVMLYFRLQKSEFYRNTFLEAFPSLRWITNEHCLPFVDNVLDEFTAEPYSHERFLDFCVKLSMYDVYMVRQNRPRLVDVALLNIFLAIWPVRHDWEANLPFDTHWKHLDKFCSMIKDGEIEHPLVEYYPQTKTSKELHFAIDVVNCIVRERLPNWSHPLRPSPIASELLTAAICSSIGYYYNRLKAGAERAFGEMFQLFPRTDGNYARFMDYHTHQFRVRPYDHVDFLKFCAKISIFALCMYNEGARPEALDYPVMCIMLAVWPMRDYSDLPHIPLHAHWKYLDLYCRSRKKNKENQSWRCNV